MSGPSDAAGHAWPDSFQRTAWIRKIFEDLFRKRPDISGQLSCPCAFTYAPLSEVASELLVTLPGPDQRPPLGAISPASCFLGAPNKRAHILGTESTQHTDFHSYLHLLAHQTVIILEATALFVPTATQSQPGTQVTRRELSALKRKQRLRAIFILKSLSPAPC